MKAQTNIHEVFMGEEYKVRRFCRTDADAVSALMIKTLKITNSKDYSPEYIENVAKKFSPESVIKKADATHFYVICEENAVVGCGAIGPLEDKENESGFFHVFVAPEYQGKGIGRKIIETLEQDELFLRSKRIELAASITACAFYKKLGYTYKNGVAALDKDLLYPLEKFRES